jgi:pseudolysin
MPAKPVYLMDAVSLDVYKQWDEVKTGMVSANGGGNGGNVKSGRLSYNGLSGQMPMLSVTRDTSRRICYLYNNRVEVRDARSNYRIMSYSCRTPDKRNNNVYWNASFDTANGGYSPANDALYAGAIVNNLYQQWYGVPPLMNRDHTPMLLTMITHLRMDNAYWDGEAMNFGDGVSYFYPLTSLGIAAHEISHGFTEQHSNLVYDGQSGGLNESFSDMASMAAEYFTKSANTWQIGGEVMKGSGSLRYMNQPSLDCNGGTPGDDCSIDNASQYTDALDVHYSSGVYNRMFYLLGTTSGWNARKAFDVMVQANASYWTPTVTFNQAACGVLSAAKDYKYDVDAVIAAFNAVGVSTSSCSSP